MSLVDDLQEKISNTWNDVTTTGIPAVIAGAEKYASDQLAAQAAQSQAQAQSALNQVVASSAPAQGVMGSIQNVLTDIGQGTFIKQYGIYIIIGAVALVIVGKKLL